MAALLKNKRVTDKDHFQDTRHIELSLGDSGLTYKPGSVLAVFPQQDAQARAAFCKLAGLDPDEWIRVESEQGLGNGRSSSMEVSTGLKSKKSPDSSGMAQVFNYNRRDFGTMLLEGWKIMTCNPSLRGA